MGKTYTILSNKLDIKVFNYKLIKGETYPGNQNNLNKGLLRDRRVNI